ncbi:uncharacterized protein TOT_040000614 [Theileria orientalis strain Shintoku]|uniref:RPAP1 C-terminal domain-containing protein n=1 Tax=Theileria orientalis strain Shintoku TaxID=869250 RepID=J4DQD1_THEOR|nr:uncharacterized protein TOT_040000614 [Theileria orientalis strain Shintoku]BAM42244.1 uncharacterized protein TOT_040000614 [Theileria orientalis strain Shintoku]|eukprot:XP_009692545.1 uncharacterized protein TOT_040000614 [Theileria orientalis strain Shintoku]
MSRKNSVDYENPLMTNDFDIVEHFSDEESDSSKNDLPVPAYDSSGFPKAKHRSESEVVLSKPQEYDEVVLKPLEEMSIQEIKEAQRYLYEKLGKEMCEFIKERNLKRMNEAEAANLKENNQKEDNTHEPSPNELIFKFDKKEFYKYQWMSPSESNKKQEAPGPDSGTSKLNLHELRFSFEGLPISGSEDVKSYEGTLYSHGLDPDKPGYTLPELLHLLQSSFKPQAQISIRALSNILFNSYGRGNSSREGGETEGDGGAFFSYSAYRWNKYINSDLDLMTKLGYSVAENQRSTIILVDSLRCMSLLTFGDSLRWNSPDSPEESLVAPAQDVLFDYYHFYSGLDVYYWNSLYLDLHDTNIYEYGTPGGSNKGSVEGSNGSAKGFLEMGLRINKEFYTKLLEGVYQSQTNEDVVRDLFVNIDLSDSEPVELESKLYLLSEHNLIYKLLLIMKRYGDNLKLQVYCTSVICGLIVSFGTPLANALIEFKPFKGHFESLLNVLTTQAGSHYVHVNGAVLYLVMLLSVYLDHIPDYFTSFIALIKETVTRSFSRQLKGLNMIDHYSEEDEQYRSYATTAVKCLTVWALRGYMFDSLDEFVPLFNLNAFKLRQRMGSGGTKTAVEGIKTTDCGMDTSVDDESYDVLAAINLQFSACLRLNDMHRHFEANGVIGGVNELIESFGARRKLEKRTAYHLYSLLQLQYDYVDAISAEEGDGELEVSESSLLNLVEAVLDSYSFEITEELVDNLTWFDDSIFTGSKSCLYRKDLVKEELDKFILPLNMLNLMLNTLFKLRLRDDKEHAANRVENSEDPVLKGLEALKKRLFGLGDELVKQLKAVYLRLHKSQMFYLNTTLYLVKSVPIFESCLVYLRTLVEMGYDMRKAAFATLALSVDYTRLEDALNMVYSEVSDGLSTEGIGKHMSEGSKGYNYANGNGCNYDNGNGCNYDNGNGSDLRVDKALSQFRDFNEYIASYSLGSNRLPLVSMLSYMSYLPLHLSKHYETGFDEALMERYGDAVGEWTSSEFMFAQTVCTINSVSEDLMANLSTERYGVFQKLLFDKLSGCKEAGKQWDIDRGSESGNLVERWVHWIRGFKGALNGDDFANKLRSERKLEEYFDNAEAMTTNCRKLIGKFNSGECDSPVTVGLIMMFTSHWSNEECAKLLWSDEALMLLLGRNLSLDFETLELMSTLAEDLALGSLWTFTFSPESAVRSQTKMLSLFSDESVKRTDPVLFLTLLSLARHSVDLRSLEAESGLVRQILDGLSAN